MAESHKAVDRQSMAGLGSLLVRFIVQPAPPHFAAANFIARLRHHLAVYLAVLAIALYICLFVFTPPIETSLISLAGFLLAISCAWLSLPFRRKRHVPIDALVTTVFVLSATALLKSGAASLQALVASLHRM